MSRGAAAEEASGGVPEASIREELTRVLSSEEFRASKRSQEFLTYVVENTLRGHADALKERSIGIDVFGRPADYDPGDDATVRVKAGEVRKRLGLYYANHGSHDRVRIELPSGTYVPEFHAAEKAAASEAAIPPPARRNWKPLAAAAIVIAIVAAAAALRLNRTATPLDDFWAPVLKGSSPVSLCVAYVPVYGTDRDPAPGQVPKLEDFTLMSDQFVGGGDLVAASRLSGMLTKKQRTYSLRVGNAVSFGDLRAAPAILVGYSYTRWKEISSQMRYFIDGSRRPIAITDNGAPTKWSLPDLPRDRRTDRDYAIVSRVFHPDTHAMLVEIAGVTQYGTDAASDLVTNSDLMAEALKGAPRGWQTKNLQLVLYSKVISGSPSSPQVVASYFW